MRFTQIVGAKEKGYAVTSVSFFNFIERIFKVEFHGTFIKLFLFSFF